MRLLANFIMQGYSQASLAAAVAAILSLSLPLAGPFSAAAVGLFTLRNGAIQGLLVSALATLGTAVLAALAFGSPWPALGMLAVFWIPIWILAGVLRSSRSLVLAVQGAVLLGLALVLGLHAFVGDPSAYWLQLLEPLRQTLANDGLVQADISAATFRAASRWMTGGVAAALVLQLLASLFLARWWQAALYNPGGFGEEFRAFRSNRLLGPAVLLLLALPSVVRGADLAVDLLLVLALLLVIQGLAVAHGVHRLTGAHRGWMLGLYLFLVLFMPRMLLLMACVGLLDLWADIRTRVARRVGQAG